MFQINRFTIMTKREIFDTVKNHLLAQNAKSTDGYNCFYRDAFGHKCAVGCLITDAAYYPDIEGKGVGSGHVSTALELSGVDEAVHHSILIRLQLLHDGYSPEDWETRLAVMENDLFT